MQELKQKALSYIEQAGPTIPVRLAKELNVDPIWAGAILSEMIQQHDVKITSMKIGSTPVYYLEGQEQKLEEFADKHLNGIPKEAYLLLKKVRKLIDNEQEPQIRIALRSLKDFAIKKQEGESIIWTYYLSEEDSQDETTEETKAIEETKEEETEEKHLEPIFEETEEKRDILAEVKQELQKLNILLLEETDVKKREFTGLGRMQGILGEEEILIIAKDKKNITDKDLEKIFEQVKDEKKQVLLFTTGEVAKKSVEFYRNYKNLIKIKSLPQ